MTELTGMTPQELSDWCKAQGMPAFRGKQIFRWIHQGADFDAMTNLPAAMRAQLKEIAVAQPVSIIDERKSQIDDTVKFLFGLKDGNCVEGVLMHYHHGYTLCISTQVGSYAYKTNGSVVLGTAEAGAKITLYNLDNLNPKTVNAKTAYFKTIHHEFGHILNQTKPYPTDFAEISGPDYVQDQCFEIYKTTESALQKGFISPYASKADGEDFVELIALYVNRSAEEWEEMLTTAGDTGRPKIEAKFEIVSNYMKSTWNIDLNELREIVLRRAEEAPNLDFDSLDDEDTDTPENSGTNE